MSAFKIAKQYFLHMYFISTDVRELHAEHKPHFLICVQLVRCTGGPWRREGRMEGRREGGKEGECKRNVTKILLPHLELKG